MLANQEAKFIELESQVSDLRNVVNIMQNTISQNALKAKLTDGELKDNLRVLKPILDICSHDVYESLSRKTTQSEAFFQEMQRVEKQFGEEFVSK